MIGAEVPFDLSEFGVDIPEIPQEYQELVAQWAGNTNGKPNARIVRGTDPELLDWCVKGWIPRYSFPEIDEVNYYVWHKPDGTKKILSPAEFHSYGNSKKLKEKMKGIILPVKQTNVVDHLIPRYFVELYRPPWFFGNELTWERHRYTQDQETGEMLDVMGEFPSEGQYETWFCIEELETDAFGKPLKSIFRPLDWNVMEFIKESIESVKLKSMAEQHLEKYLSDQKENEKRLETFKDNLKYNLNQRIGRIVGDGSNIRSK